MRQEAFLALRWRAPSSLVAVARRGLGLTWALGPERRASFLLFAFAARTAF